MKTIRSNRMLASKAGLSDSTRIKRRWFALCLGLIATGAQSMLADDAVLQSDMAKRVGIRFTDKADQGNASNQSVKSLKKIEPSKSEDVTVMKSPFIIAPPSTSRAANVAAVAPENKGVYIQINEHTTSSLGQLTLGGPAPVAAKPVVANSTSTKSTAAPTTSGFTVPTTLAPPALISSAPTQPTLTSRSPDVVRIPGMSISSKTSTSTAILAPVPTPVPSALVDNKDQTPAYTLDEVKPPKPAYVMTPQPLPLPDSIDIHHVERRSVADSGSQSAFETSAPLPHPSQIAELPNATLQKATIPNAVAANKTQSVIEMVDSTPYPQYTTSVRTEAKYTVASAPKPQPPSLSTMVPESIYAGSIEVTRRNAQAMKVTGQVTRLEVNSESICRAILTDNSNLSLMGVSPGNTTLSIWCKSPEDSIVRKYSYDVQVRETWATEVRTDVNVDEATNAISEMFPRSTIVLKQHENGSMTVYGKAESKETAKQIALLVRKMFLVPIQDRITVTGL